MSRLRHDTELPGNWRDRVSLLSDEDVLASLDADARAEVSALRHALLRMDDGTYGSCLACGEPIAQARLEALPTAATCIECAEANDAH